MTNNLSEWLVNKEELPNEVWDLVKYLKPEDDLVEFLGVVRQKLFNFYGDKRDKAQSFADSRFTPLVEMIERGMVSCGAMVHIFGTILRKFNVPVKYAHDKRAGQDTANRHSWLIVYDAKNDKWLGIDPTHEDFGMYPDSVLTKTYHDWQELKADYDKGEY